MATTINSPVVQPVLGTRVQVAYPTGQASQLGFALVQNSTAWALIVDQGGNQLGRLPAFTANAYPVTGIGTPLGFTASGASLPAGDGISVTWSDEPPPGSWPSSLVAQAVSVLGSVLATNPAVPVGVMPVSHTAGVISQAFTVPAGYHGLLLRCANPSVLGLNFMIVKVKGTTSGLVWFLGEITGATPCFVPYDSSIDPAVTITVQNPSGVDDTLTISAVPQVITDPIGNVHHSYGTNLAVGNYTLISALSIGGDTAQVCILALAISSTTAALGSSVNLTGPDGSVFLSSWISGSTAPSMSFNPPLRLNRGAGVTTAGIATSPSTVSLAYFYR